MPATLLVMAAFDVQLRERTKQGGLYGGSLFVGKFLRERLLGALAGILSFHLVDIIRTDRHVGDDENAIRPDFDEAFAHGEIMRLSLLAHDEFAGKNLGHQSFVAG